MKTIFKSNSDNGIEGVSLKDAIDGLYVIESMQNNNLYKDIKGLIVLKLQNTVITVRCHKQDYRLHFVWPESYLPNLFGYRLPDGYSVTFEN